MLLSRSKPAAVLREVARANFFRLWRSVAGRLQIASNLKFLSSACVLNEKKRARHGGEQDKRQHMIHDRRAAGPHRRDDFDVEHMPIATIRSPMATGICRSETRGIVNTVSVNGMFRRKTTMLKKANGMIRYMTLGFLRARVPKRNAKRGPPHDARSLDHVQPN